MASRSPFIRPIDRVAATVAAFALLGSVAGTIWFFAGFLENDTEFRASSSAFLLSMGLGAFAIVPSALVLKLALGAWRRGFRMGDGWWTLAMMLPWVGLSVVVLARAPLPGWAGALALLLSGLLSLWAAVSLVQLWRSPDHKPEPESVTPR